MMKRTPGGIVVCIHCKGTGLVWDDTPRGTGVRPCGGHRFEINLDKNLDEVCLNRENYGNILHLEALSDNGREWYYSVWGNDDRPTFFFKKLRGEVVYQLDGVDVPKWEKKAPCQEEL